MKHLSSPPRVMKCSCDHDFQDQQYGRQMRLHNPAQGKSNDILWRCTVCGSEKD